MRRPRTDKSTRKGRRRSRRKAFSQFVRGLILEGIGVASLAFLYFTIQTSSANRTSAVENATDLMPSDSVPAGETASAPNSSSWTEYNRRTRSRVNQSGVIGSAMGSSSSSRW